MNFDFSEDQKLVQQTARDYLREHAGLEVCRRVLEGRDAFDAALWKGAAEMGWLGAAIPEEHGGAGLGHLELVLIAEEVGRALAPIPFSSSVYLATEAILLAGSEEQKRTWLPRLASGEAIGTMALGEGPGDPELGSPATRFAGGKLEGEKLPVPDGEVAHFALVLASGEGGRPQLVLADLTGTGVSRSPIASLDPSRSLARVGFEGAAAEPVGNAGEGTALVERVLDRAAVLMAFEQIGGAERALELTREHAMGRYAFGRPIASFQALKHRFADLFCAIELARSNAYFGAWALANDNEELGVAGCAARISASEAFDLAGEEMIQIYGGVGFTWEYDCHLFYRRAKLLSLVLGSPAMWRDKLVTRLDARHAA